MSLEEYNKNDKALWQAGRDYERALILTKLEEQLEWVMTGHYDAFHWITGLEIAIEIAQGKNKERK